MMTQIPYKKQSDEIRQEVWNKTGGLCWYCGQPLVIPLPYTEGLYTGNYFHIDHVHPRRNGGIDHIDNMVPSCRTCNVSKRSKSVEEWRDYLTWVHIGKFSKTQIEWLRENGIEIPEPTPVKFYFEIVELG